jgi:hypothetical protein
MVEDAAYCPSKGMTLVFVGTCLLTSELARQANYKQILANYESLMRPYAEFVRQFFQVYRG